MSYQQFLIHPFQTSRRYTSVFVYFGVLVWDLGRGFGLRGSQTVNGNTGFFAHNILQNKEFMHSAGGSILSVREGRIGRFSAGFAVWMVSFTV